MVAQKLHELEAKISHRLTWELKVAKSYHWHRLVAKRQTPAMEDELDVLSSNQVLLWSDYEQNLTVSMAHTETGDMFSGTSRMEMPCWGIMFFQKAGDQLRTKHIIVLSSIIEHTVLVSNLLYAEVAKHIDNLPDIGEVLVRSDCGPQATITWQVGWGNGWNHRPRSASLFVWREARQRPGGWAFWPFNITLKCLVAAFPTLTTWSRY